MIFKKQLKDRVSKLENNVSFLMNELSCINFKLKNPPQYKVGDVYNNGIIIKVSFIKDFFTKDMYWHYEYILGNKIIDFKIYNNDF